MHTFMTWKKKKLDKVKTQGPSLQEAFKYIYIALT